MLFKEWILSQISQPVSRRKDACSPSSPIEGLLSLSKQLRPQTTSGQIRWLCLQNRSLTLTKENPLQCYSWCDSWYFTASRQVCNVRAFSSEGSEQGSRGRQHRRAPGTGPCESQHLAASPRPGPSDVFAASPPALARLLGRSDCSSQTSSRDGVTGRHRAAALRSSPLAAAFGSRGSPLISQELTSHSLSGTLEKEPGGNRTTPGAALERSRRRGGKEEDKLRDFKTTQCDLAEFSGGDRVRENRASGRGLGVRIPRPLAAPGSRQVGPLRGASAAFSCPFLTCPWRGGD